MPDIDEATVETQAKALAEKDGFTWELNFVAPSAPNVPIKPQVYLSDEARKRYLERIRREMEFEQRRRSRTGVPNGRPDASRAPPT
jgi:hypothetical protein